MRARERKSLTWADFDVESQTIRLHAKDSKNRKGKAIPLMTDLFTIVARCVAARRLDCPYTFHRNGQQMGKFQKVWRRACAEPPGIFRWGQGAIKGAPGLAIYLHLRNLSPAFLHERVPICYRRPPRSPGVSPYTQITLLVGGQFFIGRIIAVQDSRDRVEAHLI